MKDITALDNEVAKAERALAQAKRARAEAAVDFNAALDELDRAVSDWAEAHGINWDTSERKNVTPTRARAVQS